MPYMKFEVLGETLTEKIREFMEEGAFAHALNTLNSLTPKDQPFPDDFVENFFKYKVKFIGKLSEDSLCATEDDGSAMPEDYLPTAVRTMIASYKYDYFNEHGENIYPTELDLPKLIEARYEDALLFDQYFGVEKYIQDNIERLLRCYLEYGEIIELHDVNSYTNGVILPNGTFIRCGSRGHIDLYDELHEKFGLATSCDWTEDILCFHVSEGQLSGKLTNMITFDSIRHNEAAITEAQWEALEELSDTLSVYGETSDLKSILGKARTSLLAKGGKYNNLMILKRLYGDYCRLPKFSLTKPDYEYCVRSSPRFSMAGILDSYFGDDVVGAEEKMQAKFEQFKHVRANNELHWFYQEYIEGPNGVAHFDDKGLRYAMSDNRGDIVGGKGGNLSLSYEHGKELEVLAERLFKSYKQTIQLEFVIGPDNLLYILQMRTFAKVGGTNFRALHSNLAIIAKGRSFYSDDVEVRLDECLVTEDGELPSEALVGKKGLIVVNSDEFSHLLALSATLKIPSIQLDEMPDLPEKFIINTTAAEGYIQESWK